MSTSSYVMLTAGGQQYAVPAASVNEIVGLPQVTRVPKMPACVRGLMNLRGTVVPVIDLSEKLGTSATETTQRTCVAVVSTEVDGAPTRMGVVVDEVIDVVPIIETDIAPPPAFGSPIDVAYLTGITKLHDHYVLILDLTRILSPEELLSVTRRGGARP